jgi:glycosyltransferase involved in cell wall biosynthesis
VGFLGDAYEKKLKSFIQAQPDPSIFICFPFLGTEEKRELYNAADMAIWQKVSISVQEALGTGLPVLLENKVSQSHLVKDEHNGWYYDPDKLKETLEKAVQQIAQKKSSSREVLAKENAARYSYDTIASHILKTVLN